MAISPRERANQIPISNFPVDLRPPVRLKARESLGECRNKRGGMVGRTRTNNKLALDTNACEILAPINGGKGG